MRETMGMVVTERRESRRALRTLTAQEIETYWETGYVVVPDIFPVDELEAIDAEIDRLLAEPGNDAGGIHPTWIFQVARRSEMARQLAEDERLLALVERVVEPGIAIHSSKLVPKPPHSNDVCHWHQDEAFYFRPDDPQTLSRKRMSVWVPLQDAHEQNGCLYVVPKSHEWGLQEHKNKDFGQCRYSMDEEEIREILDKQAIAVPVPAGSAVLFSALLWHGSKGNQTGKVRRAFITSYQEATVPKGNGPQWRIVRPA